MLVFFYPQFKKLTGAERLVLALADYAARALPPGSVCLLTHRFAESCREALSPAVRLVETGWRMRVTGNHYLDAAIEYLLGPALALRLPVRRLDAVIFFGPPSVPAMWFTRRVLLPARRQKASILYFCFEPPRFIYSDTDAIARRLGALGILLRAAAFLYRYADRRMLAAAGQVLSNSPYGARKIMRAYGRSATVIEHGVDLPRSDAGQVDTLRRRYGLEGKRVAVTVNHLHPRKRIDLFLDAVAFAAKLTPDTVALVVGGGPEQDSLTEHARRLGLEPGRDAVFTGAVPEGELAAHYRLGDVYVHTGREESFGLSVIEALSFGLPVVSVNEGGPCDTVQHGESGYLVQADAAALGEAIARLLLNPEHARGMGHAGARFVREHFRWERGADTLLRAIERERSHRPEKLTVKGGGRETP